jgi:hypothetical protein
LRFHYERHLSVASNSSTAGARLCGSGAAAAARLTLALCDLFRTVLFDKVNDFFFARCLFWRCATINYDGSENDNGTATRPSPSWARITWVAARAWITRIAARLRFTARARIAGIAALVRATVVRATASRTADNDRPDNDN